MNCEKKYTIRELTDRMIPKPKDLEGSGSSWWYVCPECHAAVDHQDNYCRYCGQALERSEIVK